MTQRVLNVGSGDSLYLPPIYRGWEQVRLDIDPAVKPDVVCDAKEMRRLKGNEYDSVFCSHTLEHFYRHEVPGVLAGLAHVLKPDGFVYVTVPDLQAVMEAVVKGGRDIDETWYQSNGGPISFHDVLYGWSKQMAHGNLYYAHHTGFSAKGLAKAMRAVGMVKVLTACDGSSIHAYGFKSKPSKAMLKRLGI